MKEPEKVAKCIESLKNNCNLPVTIKHRIGVDNDDSFVNLNNFVRIIANAGADRFAVHARTVSYTHLTLPTTVSV